jgi:hypothetical protein
MREDFLHYLWKHKKFHWQKAKTYDGNDILLLETGRHNQTESGPDFFNAKLKIGEQLWAGNVEIHLKSSDWYFHQHETDPAYDNVILHVVWENDVEVFRKNNSAIPTLELKNLTDKNTLANYRKLLENQNPKWINCEKDFAGFDDFEVENWLERMYLERLEKKSERLLELLEKSNTDWEAVLFKMLAKNFGLNVNGEAFLSMAESIPFSVVRKISHDREQLEALFFGQAGMLEENIEEAYFQKLQKEYAYLKTKFKLDNRNVLPVKYFRLRPDNFPNIRLAQLAGLYASHKQLFSKTIKTKTINGLRKIFQTHVSDFWQSHYTFEKKSRKRAKKLTAGFVDLLIINTIVPLIFCYARFSGNLDPEKLFALMRKIETEKNSIISKFNQTRKGTAKNALDSHALLQLKKHYCEPNLCLQCGLGAKLLQKKEI